MELGNKLKELRIKKNLTQQEVADKLDVSRPTISNWETERSYPDLQALVELSQIFDISVDSLLDNQQLVKKMSEDMERGRNINRKVAVIAIPLVFIILTVAWIIFAGVNQTVVSVDKINITPIQDEKLTNKSTVSGSIVGPEFEGISSIQAIRDDDIIYMYIYSKPKIFSAKKFNVELGKYQGLSLSGIKKVILISGGVLNTKQGISYDELKHTPSQKIIWKKTSN